MDRPCILDYLGCILSATTIAGRAMTDILTQAMIAVEHIEVAIRQLQRQIKVIRRALGTKTAPTAQNPAAAKVATPSPDNREGQAMVEVHPRGIGGRKPCYDEATRATALTKIANGETATKVATDLGLTPGQVTGMKFRNQKKHHGGKIQERADQILAIIGNSRIRYSALSAKLNFSKGSLSVVLQHLIADGKLKKYQEGVYGPPDAPEIDLPPARGVNLRKQNRAPDHGAIKITVRSINDAPSPDGVLTPAQRDVLRAIRKNHGDGVHPTWESLKTMGGVRGGAIMAVLEALENRGLIVRDAGGIRPAGTAPLAIAPPRFAPPDDPPPRAAPKTDNEKILEFLAVKGASHASDESPTLDDITKLLKSDGKTLLTTSVGSTLYKVNGQKKWNYEVLTIANRIRQDRGLPVWDSRRVRWPRQDGTTEPPKVSKSAAKA
jgi:hypothetical protein